MHNHRISGTVQDVPTTSGIKKLFVNPPELHRINTQRNQKCRDLSRRCVGLWNYQEEFEKRTHAVKSRLREKNFTINGKNVTQNQSIALASWDTPFQGREKHQIPKTLKKSKSAKAPTNNKQLESIVGLSNFYGRLISDFATKKLPLNNIRNSNFSWGKMQQKAFEDIKNELCACTFI